MNKKCVWQILLILILISFNGKVFSQTYKVNGDAVDRGNGLVKMAQDVGSGATPQKSSAWSTTKIDLTQPFDMSFNMFFGCESGPNGGDGMTFTFHNDLRGLNAIGAPLGFLGIGGNDAEKVKPSLSIEFDTWNAGAGVNDIADDHIAINIDGDVQHEIHKPKFIGPNGEVEVQSILGNRDLESCAANANDFYTIRIVWDPVNKILQLYEEDQLTMTYSNDVIANIFGGNSMVYWGFTSATGDASNEQWIAPAGQNIPWECTTNTCCTPFTFNVDGPTTICNNPITLSIADAIDYEDFTWSNGSQTATTEITQPGTYTVVVRQKQAEVLCPSEETIIIVPTGPTATLSGGGITCPDEDLDLSVALTGTGPWEVTYTDGIEQKNKTFINPPYTISGTPTHTYSLISVTDNGGCNGVVSGTASVTTYSGIPIGHDTVFVIGQNATFKVDDEGGTYEWYDDEFAGSNVGSGGEILIGGLTGNTTYFVENTAITAFGTKSVSLFDKNEGTGPDPNNVNNNGLPKADLWLNFTANSDFVFQSVNSQIHVVLPWNNASIVSVTIQDLTAGTSFTKDSIGIPALPAGTQNFVMPLNYSCIAGHNYRISYEGSSSIKGIMYWQLVGSYPLNQDVDEISITGSGVPNTRYPGLFDWKILYGNPASACGRTPVTAYLCPSGNIQGNSKVCDNGTETTSVRVELEPSTTAPWTINYTFNGVPQTPITGITSSPYTFTSQPGVGVYELTKVTKSTPPNLLEAGCKDNFSGTFTVGLKPLPPVGINQTFVGPASVTLSVVEVTGASYFWYTTPTGGTPLNAVSSSSYTTPVINDTTTYYVEVVLDGYTSCSRTAVIAYESGELLIPNLVTANNDNKNDRFEIQALPNESQLQIFNRWGKKVYHDLNYKNTWGNDDVAPGIYFYDLILPDGKAYKGWVNVVK